MIKNILLAEDDLTSAYLVKRQLESCGFRISLAGNGLEALQIIARTDIDLLITDVVMPEMDGVDLYLALKNNPGTVNLPIIIITDKAMFKESFAALGVDHFIPKSSNINLLINKIHDVEKLSLTPLNYRKILIGGSHNATVVEMKSILQHKGWLVTTAENSMELASKVFLMTPHAIFLDILMTENASASELIAAFRALNLFKETAIITYVHLSPGFLTQDYSLTTFVTDEVKACQAAGATKHIGRFNPTTFHDIVSQLSIPVAATANARNALKAMQH